VEAFRRQNLGLDEGALGTDDRDWLKLWIDPWYRLARRQPPAWMRRRMLAVLLDVHRSWHERLAVHEAATGTPFDCQLWLLDPDFMGSQVVWAVGDMRAWYHDTFPPAGGDVPPRPPALYDGPSAGLDALTWSPVYDVAYTTDGDLDADPDWRRQFERRHRSRVLEVTPVGDGLQYTYRTGRGWVGRRPGSTPWTVPGASTGPRG